MLKLRLKRNGRKKQPAYRLVVMEHSTRRDGRPVDDVGYYNTITKQSYFDIPKINKWLERGVKPTKTVASLLNKNLNN
jgi:small subunit ribosomal protein S16